MPPKKFCAAPWVVGVQQMTGLHLPCCHTAHPYGDWRKDSLAGSWGSQEAISLRQSMIDGEYPNLHCEVCHKKGTASTFKSLILMPLHRLGLALKTHLELRIGSQSLERKERKSLEKLLKPGQFGHIANIRTIFDKIDYDPEADSILKKYFAVLDEHLSKSIDDRHVRLIQKFRVIGEITQDYLMGSLSPRHVAPFRQVNAVAVCIARCVHCPGRYSRTIVDGLPMPNGDRKKWMEHEEVMQLLDDDSIIDFVLNGSEFFLVRNWRSVALKIRQQESQLRITTNGMLLTEETSRFLIDSEVISKINVSLDGASPRLVESIRVNVDFAQVRRQLIYLLSYARERGHPLDATISFVAMRQNFREIPAFIGLAAELREHSASNVRVVIQPLTTAGPTEYVEFAKTQHLWFEDRSEVEEVFREALTVARELDVWVSVYSHLLDAYVAAGCPLNQPTFIVSHSWDRLLATI